MRLLLSGGRVIDPGNMDDTMDIFIENGKIIDIQPHQVRETRNPNFERIDASKKIVTPGLIDMHVHLREPGFEFKETIQTGCLAAVSGGFTAVCAMPNTNPQNDNSRVTEYIIKQARLANTARVYPVAAISKGLHGKNVCNFNKLKESGAIAFSDDGRPVMNSRVMRTALEYAKASGMPIISHCEDLNLSKNGVMNEGDLANRMGFAGIPNVSESIMVMRDIALCELTGARLHIAHVSTAESVEIIRNAKKRGVPVTAETAPHYFMLTEDAIMRYHTNAKMNPPLRSRRDMEAIRWGLADGTIDVIATDHAPHTVDEKNTDFNLAPNGVIGLETSVPISFKLVQENILELKTLIEKMSTNPARILGFDNRLTIGHDADLTIVDPDASYTIDADRFRSRGRNTPFDGWDVTGKAVMTLVGGNIVYQDEGFF